jgi:predicted transcriptional regulator
MVQALDLENRKKIYLLIEANPGLNLSTIAEKLTINIPLADYHLHYLEETNLISSVKEGGYKRYYIKGEIGEEDKKILSLLQQDYPLQIVTFLLEHPHSKPRDIKTKVLVSSALLSYYLRKLVKYKVIGESLSGEKKEFAVVNEELVVRLLIQYKPNILLQRFKDSWTKDVPLSSKIPKDKK